jgi:hypothetical protein
MERCNADSREPVLPPLWNRLGERTLETHQLVPVDLKLAA